MKKHLNFYTYFFLCVFGNSMIAMYLGMFLKSRGIGETNIGSVLTVYHLVMPIVILTFGYLADRLSCRRMILLGSFLSVIFCITMPRLGDVRLMGIAAAFQGMALMLSFISLNVLFFKIIGMEERGKLVSTFVAFQMTGYALGTALAGLLVRSFNQPTEIIFHVALPFHAVAFLIAITLPEAPIKRFPLIKYFHDMKRIPVLCLTILAFVLGIHWGSEKFSLVRYMDETLNASGWQIAALFVGCGIALAIFIRLGGYLIDVKGNFAKYLVIGMIISGSLHIVTGWTQSFAQILIVRIVHTAGDAFIIFGLPMLVSVAFPKGRMGGNFGFNRTWNSIGGGLGSFLSGWLVARFHLGSAFHAAGIFMLTAAAIIWLLRGHLPRKPDAGASKENSYSRKGVRRS